MDWTMDWNMVHFYTHFQAFSYDSKPGLGLGAVLGLEQLVNPPKQLSKCLKKCSTDNRIGHFYWRASGG